MPLRESRETRKEKIDMGWSIGFDSTWNRDIGYGVPAFCDHPGCNKKIDRGLAYVCGGAPYGGWRGCGLFFCDEHRGFYNKKINGSLEYFELCYRCGHYKKPYTPKPDHPEWIAFKLVDKSWDRWRSENPELVEVMKRAIGGGSQKYGAIS
jgi:hypothetical protein